MGWDGGDEYRVKWDGMWDRDDAVLPSKAGRMGRGRGK